jgi:hypothetical protein
LRKHTAIISLSSITCYTCNGCASCKLETTFLCVSVSHPLRVCHSLMSKFTGPKHDTNSTFSIDSKPLRTQQRFYMNLYFLNHTSIYKYLKHNKCARHFIYLFIYLFIVLKEGSSGKKTRSCIQGDSEGPENKILLSKNKASIIYNR